MKQILTIATLMLFCANCHAAIDDNVDYDFINNAFTDKPYTNQDFEKVMAQYEKKPEGFLKKAKKFFDRDKVKYDEAFKKKYENTNNQPARIKDVPEDKPTLLIPMDAVDSTGNPVIVGYYQVEIKKNEDGKYTLELMQGANKHIATIMAREIDEDEKAETIVYGRAEVTNNGYIKIIYANLDVTLLGYLKAKGGNNSEFEPLY